MAAIDLTILEPENNTVIIGTPSIIFRGRAMMPDELVGVPMFYRWYSSFFVAAKDHYSMNETALTNASTSFSYPSEIGSHVITFAASDQAGESDADFEAMQHGGVTGGAEKGENQCLIHIFTANILAATVAGASVTLKAEAPSLWTNVDYIKYNRLQYHWLFEPVGLPSGRPTHAFIPTIEEMAFEPDPEPVRVSYTASLPVTTTGNYQITLFVEDKLGEILDKHQDQTDITFLG